MAINHLGLMEEAWRPPAAQCWHATKPDPVAGGDTKARSRWPASSSTAWERTAHHHPGSFWAKGLGAAHGFGQALEMVQLEGDLATRPNSC